jgi:hypothetical protein
MAYEVIFGTLTATQKADAADLLQKMEALDAALADIQTERATMEASWGKKSNFITQQKSNIKDALRALRVADIKEV